MPVWRHLLLVGLVSAQAGCAALNYPAETTDAEPAAPEAPEAPVLLEVGLGEGVVDLATLEGAEANTARTWYELAREARRPRLRSGALLTAEPGRILEFCGFFGLRPSFSVKNVPQLRSVRCSLCRATR